MNPSTGAIAQFETELDAKDAGFTLALSKEQAEALLAMNRKQRREWAATTISKQSLERISGKTQEDD